MFRYTNHVCKKCFLQNDPFHKVTLNEDGVCSLCAKPAPEEARRDWDALEKRFAAHLDRVRGTRPYEGLIMMSGGKDSAYLADLLKETYGMRLLGFIIDINYEYPETFENAKTIARKLDLPYVVFRQEPEAMRRYYRFLFTEKALLQPDGGQVCTFCGRFLIHSACAFARRMGIPLVFSGHNPDQIFLMGESIRSRMCLSSFSWKRCPRRRARRWPAGGRATGSRSCRCSRIPSTWRGRNCCSRSSISLTAPKP